MIARDPRVVVVGEQMNFRVPEDAAARRARTGLVSSRSPSLSRLMMSTRTIGARFRSDDDG